MRARMGQSAAEAGRNFFPEFAHDFSAVLIMLSLHLNDGFLP